MFGVGDFGFAFGIVFGCYGDLIVAVGGVVGPAVGADFVAVFVELVGCVFDGVGGVFDWVGAYGEDDGVSGCIEVFDFGFFG